MEQSSPQQTRHGRAVTTVASPGLQNQQRSGLALSPVEYAVAVQQHSETSSYESLYQGEHLSGLAEFLRPVRSRDFGTLPPEGTVDEERFATYFRPDSEESPRPQKLCLPLCPPIGPRNLLPQENGIVFLNGYPSARWLAELGGAYHVDPEFFQRHLHFLRAGSHSRQTAKYSLPLLPSFQSTILQIPITSVGWHASTIYRDVADKRAAVAQHMAEYWTRLERGSKWKTCDSIVRSFAVHDKNEFSIQQYVTVYVSTKSSKDDNWKVFVWFDSGKPLGMSPDGPWTVASRNVFFEAVALYKPGVALKRHKHPGPALSPSDPGQTFQSISHFPPAYCKSLDPRVLRQDPFYALTEIFSFAAVSERQFLSAIAVQIDRESERLLTDIEGISHKLEASILYLEHLLEDHIKSIIETSRYIQNRGSLNWPRSNADKAQRAASRLQLDFETLLEQAQLLRERCAREFQVLLNKVALVESERSIARSRQTLRLTLLATLYVPLTATATMFGMNFVNFKSFSQGAWIWITLTLPIAIGSFLLVMWNQPFIAHFLADFRSRRRKNKLNS